MKYFKPLFITCLLILCIGSCTFIELALQGESNNQEDTGTDEAPEIVTGSAAEISSDFANMYRRTRGMRASRIRGMSNSAILDLGSPILSVASQSVIYGESTLQKLEEPVHSLAENARTISASDHARLSRQIMQIIRMDNEDEQGSRDFTTDEIREFLLNINQDNTTATCSGLFNVLDNSVILAAGDNFNVANMICPSGSVFVVLEGIHIGQMVESSREGNTWIGVGSAIIDGEEEIQRAFNGGLDGNTISHLEIQNYTDHGVYSTRTENLLIRYVTFNNIAADKHGQEFGAVMFHNSRGITVRDSHIENAASGIRFRDSNGPLQVIGNTALNSGRNFFQCDKCNGPGIRINRNSMEHTEQTGRAPLEDWINLFMSNGTAGDRIQVNHNRAKGHSESDSGSFIMLADATGSFQEAIGNIGINPGQVGIGIASGTNIKVEGNKMFSVQWAASNVAYYSAEYSSPCGGHEFTANSNIAHWRNSNGTLNRAWSDGNCGITNVEIRNLVREDRNMGPEIWNEW